MRDFTPDEFLSRLSTTRHDVRTSTVTIGGLAKADEKDPSVLLFSTSLSCEAWTPVPTAMVESISELRTVRCKDHSHPLVTLTLKDGATPETAALLAMIQGLQRQLRFLARRPGAGTGNGNVTFGNNNNIGCELVSTEQGLFLCCLGGGGEVECTDVLKILEPF
jgi:hypothetical protein